MKSEVTSLNDDLNGITYYISVFVFHQDRLVDAWERNLGPSYKVIYFYYIFVGVCILLCDGTLITCQECLYNFFKYKNTVLKVLSISLIPCPFFIGLP